MARLLNGEKHDVTLIQYGEALVLRKASGSTWAFDEAQRAISFKARMSLRHLMIGP
jgi:hypothetical protein